MKFANRDNKPEALAIVEGFIPAELKALPNWVTWRYEWRVDKKTGKGEWAKPPEKGAKNNDLSTWHTFDEAFGRYLDGGWDGLYFALPLDGGITFTDLDDCVIDFNESAATDGFTDAARVLVDALKTYTEYSPSGRGFHCVNFGSKPGKASKMPQKHTFEMYDGKDGNARFMSVTGQWHQGCPGTISKNQDAINAAYTHLFGEIKQSEPRREQREQSGERMPDRAIIQKAIAAKNGDKFKRLFVDGDTSEYAGDDSAADMALCDMLRYWCGEDPVQIDGLFRESDLYRSKWDEHRGESTYGEITIQKAIALGGDVYTGRVESVTSPLHPEDDTQEKKDARCVRALSILEYGEPDTFILGTFNTLHVGDREVGEGRLLSTCAQHVRNSLGLQSKLTGGSGKGKSDAEKKMAWLHPQEYYVYARLTDKAIYYHPNLKPGSTIFSDDVKISDELEGVIKTSTSNFQRVTQRLLPVKDKDGNYKGKFQDIPERLNWALTSVRTQGSDELIKRQMGYDVDESAAQDEAYIEFERNRAEKAVDELPITEDILTSREIIRIIKENEDGSMRLIGVDMPFYSRIVWTDTENRRNFNIFLDMVRAFTMLRFMQRERSDEGSIIATETDFNDAKRHYSARAGLQKLHLDDIQQKFCQHIAALGGEADTPMMQVRMKKPRADIYAIADSLERIYPPFHSEIRKVPVGDDEKKTTNRRFYELNVDTREGFTLDAYSSVVYLESGDDDD
jgi:hypothetical protein